MTGRLHGSPTTGRRRAFPPTLDGDANRRLHIAILAGGTTWLVASLIHTAWLCDDAFITFRTADNFLHGFGLVWNVGERVQGFTHPLWLALLLPAYAAFRNPYVAILLGLLLTVGAICVIVLRVARSAWQRLVCFAALLSSKAFIDFATSGLENSLGYLLVAVFLWQWWDEPIGQRRTRRLTCLWALCVLTRPDLGVLVGPAILVDAFRAGLRSAVRPIAIGLLPLIGWEMFSIVYYGFFVPNTAYAKLNTGLAGHVLLQHGLNYYSRTLTADPITLPVIALAPLSIGQARWRGDWPIVAGLLFYCVYILTIGGDFMMGRFFAIPFCLAVGLLSRASWFDSPKPAVAAAAACLVAGLFAPWEPALFSGYGYERLDNLLHGTASPEPRDRYANMTIDDITDERRYYSSLAWLRTRGTINHDWAALGRRLRREQRRVAVLGTVGLAGYFAGPEVHIIDQLALAEPLLARLPAWPRSRAGHFGRDIPAGYPETIESGRNSLVDPQLARFYNRLHLIVSGPLWSRQRFSNIATMQFVMYAPIASSVR
jgi:arabinofuranosyltransferase